LSTFVMAAATDHDPGCQGGEHPLASTIDAAGSWPAEQLTMEDGTMNRLHLATLVLAAAALTACGKKEELPAPTPAPTPVADAASAAVTESVEAAKAIGDAASAAATAAGNAASAAAGAAVDTAKGAVARVTKEKKGGC
jgi:hypothetical protein